MDKWNKAQEWESSWWGDCTNTFGEELKQYTYAKYMGIPVTDRGNFEVSTELSVMDVGGGAVSMLLKTPKTHRQHNYRVVIDPLSLPDWVGDRYDDANIDLWPVSGEDFLDLPEVRSSLLKQYDEVWIYNCLQHTKDPRKVIENAKKVGKKIRIFEWLEVATNVGHIHTLHKTELDYWLGKEGNTVELHRENGCDGLAYYNIVDL